MKILEVLQSADNADYCENPPEFNRSLTAQRIIQIKEDLNNITGFDFSIFWSVQEATYFSELTLRSPFQENGYIFVRFSYFGNFFIIFSEPESNNIPHDFITNIIDICVSRQFIYVENSDLNIPYAGENQNFIGGTWRNRFFGSWDEI